MVTIIHHEEKGINDNLPSSFDWIRKACLENSILDRFYKYADNEKS